MEKYLNENLKSYYENAYEEVKATTNEFWKIDKGLAPFLEQINSNANIQSIYSKQSCYLGGYKLQSYLAIAYVRKVELTLFRKTIPFFISKYNSIRDFECTYEYRKPYKREDKHYSKDVIDLSCVKDVDYFNINHIRLELVGIGPDEHEEFWHDLTKHMSSLK